MYNIYKFQHARDCLKFLISKFNIKQIYIPYYLCDVIRHSIVEIGCKPLFYHIDSNFMPTYDFQKDSFILYPNYFGIFRHNVEILEQKYPNLIVDNAHAYYDSPAGFACFNSGKKFGYGEQAYLWIKNINNENKTESITTDIRRKQQCINKFLHYHNIYSGINLITPYTTQNIFPFVYPLLCSAEQIADNIVKNLTEQENLTIYRYWNSLPKSYEEYKFYSRLVPIPVSI